MAGALLNVRMESNQLAMQKAVLENKLNQTDAEFALAMAEANDDSFPFNKEQVEKYYEMKAKEVIMCSNLNIDPCYQSLSNHRLSQKIQIFKKVKK